MVICIYVHDRVHRNGQPPSQTYFAERAVASHASQTTCAAYAAATGSAAIRNRFQEREEVYSKNRNTTL